MVAGWSRYTQARTVGQGNGQEMDKNENLLLRTSSIFTCQAYSGNVDVSPVNATSD